MKTSLDIPEDLYRSIKVKAAQEGRKVSDLVADGLRLLLNAPAPGPKRRVQFPLFPAKRGQRVLTDEMVYAAEAEVWEEEAKQAAAFMRR